MKPHKGLEEIHICHLPGFRIQAANCERLLKSLTHLPLVLLLDPDKRQVDVTRRQRLLRRITSQMATSGEPGEISPFRLTMPRTWLLLLVVASFFRGNIAATRIDDILVPWDLDIDVPGLCLRGIDLGLVGE